MILIGFILFFVVLAATFRFYEEGFSIHFPTIAGLALLFIAYWQPWIGFSPHEHFTEVDIFTLGDFITLALEQIEDFPGSRLLLNLLQKIFLFASPPAPLLALIMPAWSIVLRLLILFVIPLLFLCTLFKMLAEMLSGHFWRWLAIAQTVSAAIVLLLLLWKLPEIDGAGQPNSIEAGLLVLALAPQMGPGPWVAIQAILLLIIGGIIEADYQVHAASKTTQTSSRRHQRR